MTNENQTNLIESSSQNVTSLPCIPSSATEELGTLFYSLFPSTTPRGERDFSYFDALVHDFGTEFDIDEEMKRFHAWTLDRPQGPITSPRSRFRDWMLRTRTYKLNTFHR